jgi:hypothetical protein
MQLCGLGLIRRFEQRVATSKHEISQTQTNVIVNSPNACDINSYTLCWMSSRALFSFLLFLLSLARIFSSITGTCGQNYWTTTAIPGWLKRICSDENHDVLIKGQLKASRPVRCCQIGVDTLASRVE